jgi:hypothetical protein
MPNINKFIGKILEKRNAFQMSYFSGDANEITLKDLKPATEYHLK